MGAGLLLWLAFPDVNIWAGAPLGIALFAAAVHGVRARTGAWLGMLAGLVFFVSSLHWTGIYVGSLPWLALSTLEAGYWAIAGAWLAWLSAPPAQPAAKAHALAYRALPYPLLVALTWVVTEWLRGATPWGGFPWVRVAFSQADAPFGRLAAWGGAPGVSFAVALCGGLLAVAALRLWSQRGDRPAGMRRAGVLVILALLVPALGYAVSLPVDGPPLQVMAVQGNVPEAGLDFNAERRAVLDNHVQGTLRGAAEVAAGKRAQPDLVVWPENSSDIDPDRNLDARAEIIKATNTIDAPLLMGTLSLDPWPSLYNVAVLYEPGRGAVERYIKQHPVPFAEYIPAREFFRIFSPEVDRVANPFIAGDKLGLFPLGERDGIPVVAGTTICFEVAYDDIVSETVRAGATLLVVQTNNATFGYTNESTQQLAISRLRAMEHGRSVAHVSTVGVSALITPDGVAHQSTELYTAAVLSGDLPLRTDLTVADRLGDWPLRVVILLLLFASGLRWSLWWRRRAGYRSPDTTDEG